MFLNQSEEGPGEHPKKGPVLLIFRISHDFHANPREIAHKFLLVPWNKKPLSVAPEFLEAQKNRLHCSKQGSSRRRSDQNDWRLDGRTVNPMALLFAVVFFWCFGKDKMMKLNSIFVLTLPLCSWKVLGLREHVGMAHEIEILMQYGTTPGTACRKDIR